MINSGKRDYEKARITDVADRAGVSIATVSRVLHRNYPVSDETRTRVSNAIKELNYTPNFMASRMKNRKDRLIGVILPNLLNDTVMHVAEVLLSELRKKGFLIFFACSENNKQVELSILELFRSSLVDAVVASSVLSNAEMFKTLESQGIPVVLFDRYLGEIDWVGEDGFQASYEMIKYIINRGHRKIAVLKGLGGTSISLNRYNGYLAALNEAGIAVNPQYQLQGDFSEKLAYELTRDMLSNLKQEDYPTAIFCANSNMAIGAIDAINEAGLRIPEDISIACYGEIVIPKYLRPRPSCVRQDYRELSKQICRLIVEKIEKLNDEADEIPKSPARIVVGTTIFEGETVADIR